MKKERMKGFLAGFLTAALMLGLGVSALAAGRTIEVGDKIKITINGAEFSPKDAAGKAVEVFTYNGTTYAPLRAICEAAGLQVDYDPATRTAAITTADVAQAARPSSGSYITSQQAQEAALTHAGVSFSDAIFLKVRLDWHDGKAKYDVEFYSGATEYDYEIDASTGTVLGWDLDCDDYDIRSAGLATDASGLITEEQAKQIALDQAPAGTVVVKCKLDRDHDRYVYEVELRNGRTEYECEINAATGVILEWEVDH